VQSRWRRHLSRAGTACGLPDFGFAWLSV
jgi:hypothetical protein